MSRQLTTLVRATHFAVLVAVVAVATSQAAPGPISTAGCCNKPMTDCQGCKGKNFFGVVSFFQLPVNNVYNRCGSEGISVNGCSETIRSCYDSPPNVLVPLYSQGNCTNLTGFSPAFSINAVQCPVDTLIQTPCVMLPVGGF